MKKLLLTTAVLVLLLIVAWLGASWLIGLQTEKQVRQYLEDTDGQHTLVDYQRSLLSSRVVTRLNVGQTPLGQWVDTLPLVHDIMHGPVIWQSEPKPGLSHWQTRLDQGELDEHISELVDTAFASAPPFLAETHVDFNQMATYQIKMLPLQADSEEGNLSFTLDGLQLSGQWPEPATDSPQSALPTDFEVSTGQIVLSNDDITVSLPSLKMSTADSGVTDEINVDAAGMSVVFPEEPEPLLFNLTARTTTAIKDNDLQGDITLSLDQFSGLTYPLKRLDLKLNFSGVNQPALTEVNRLQNRMQDIQAQLAWGDEEMDLPEARRQMTQLDIELRDVADQLLAVLFQKALQADKTRLNYDLNIVTEQGEIVNTAKLHYAGTDQPVGLADLVESGVPGLIRFIRGDIELNVAQAVLPAELSGLLSYPLERKGFIESGDEYRMDLRLLKSDMELNGRVIEYGELMDKFMPPSMLADDSHNIPDDVWDMVEAQGLSDALIRQLELRDDISAESLEILKQLQETSQILQK